MPPIGTSRSMVECDKSEWSQNISLHFFKVLVTEQSPILGVEVPLAPEILVNILMGS